MHVVVAKSQKEILDNSLVRGKVFIIGQNIPWEIEFDGMDHLCVLFTAYQGDTPVGAARLYKNKVGRVATLEKYRKQGVGKLIMKAIEDYAKTEKLDSLVLHAQAYVEDFYSKLGYIKEGDVFYEADIPHVKMTKKIYHRP
jgi:predicted GNAT family N-acyltransferase